MNNIIITTVFVSLLFILFKLIETRFIQKSDKSLKELIRDTLIVAISSLIALYSIEQFYTSVEDTSTNAFIGTPDF